MGKLKRLAGETVLYGLGNIVPKSLNFLLVYLHTAVYAPAEYGVITKLMSYVGVINTLFMFGMETAYFRYATKAGGDEQKIFNLAQTVVVSISLVLSGIIVFAAQPIANALLIPEHANLVTWTAGIMLIDAIVAIPFARLRLQKKPLQYALGKVINIGIYIAFNIYFLKVAFNPTVGVDYVILANLLANVFYIFFFAKTLLAWRPSNDKTLTPGMLAYGYPIMLMGLAGMTNEMFSRQTLDWWLPANFYPGQSAEHALGVFGACYKLATLMALAVQAFRYAAEPFFFSNASDKNSPALFARINHYFIIVCCVLLLGVSINLDVLKYFLGNPAYWEGLAVVPILLLSYLFMGVYYNLSVWFKLTDKTYYGTAITVGGMVITVLGNYLLIPVAGYMGSSIATLVCYFTMTLANYLLGQKHYPIPYTVGRSIAYITGTTILVYGVNLVQLDNLWLSMLFHGGVIVAYLSVVYLLEKNSFRQPTI